MADPLKNARMSLAWARKHIDSIEVPNDGRGWTLPARLEMVPVLPPVTFRLMVSNVDPFPEGIREDCHDAVDKLRQTLDFAASEASHRTTGARSKNCNFPAADYQRNFAGCFGPGGKSRDIPHDLRGAIEAVKPWWPEAGRAGNQSLRDLMWLSNPNKHEFPLLPMPKAGMGINQIAAMTIRFASDIVVREEPVAMAHIVAPHSNSRIAGFPIFMPVIDLKDGSIAIIPDFLRSAAAEVERAVLALESELDRLDK